MRYLNKYAIILLFILLTLFLIRSNALCLNNRNKVIGLATFVDHIVLNTIRDSMINKLHQLGYTENKGWKIIIKSANGQMSETNNVAEEIIRLNPSIITSISTPATKPLYELNNGIYPLVYSFVSFPEEIGIVPNSKNVTGLSDGVDFQGTFGLIKSLLGTLNKIGMIYSDEPNAVASFTKMNKVCKVENVLLVAQIVSRAEEIPNAISSLVAGGVDCIFVGADSTVVKNMPLLVEIVNFKVPIFTTDEGSVKQGALAALSVNYKKFGEETARLIDFALQVKSADCIKPQKYYGKDVVLNSISAEKMKIDIPNKMLKSAYKVY